VQVEVISRNNKAPNGALSKNNQIIKAARPQARAATASEKNPKVTESGEAQPNKEPHVAKRASLKAAGEKSRSVPDKRTLRSHDGGSRLKSDLATYFGNYDDIINGVPQEPEYIAVEHPIYIIDEPFKNPPSDIKAAVPLPGKDGSNASPSKLNSSKHGRKLSLTGPPTSPHLNGSKTVDLASLLKSATTVSSAPTSSSAGIGSIDPLPDSVYLKAHGRAERREKQLRNIEKERAQHEKVQLELLLEGLKGPDWLKVMGVTGVTDGERKGYEPKRDYFIREVKSLVKKFHDYRMEEKRLKAKRDEQKAAEEENEDEDGEEDEEEEDEADDDGVSTGPNSSDLDAWAAHQLQQEASQSHQQNHRSRNATPTSTTPRPKKHPPGLGPPKTPTSGGNKRFTSFYSAPHLRAQALGKSRQQSRSSLAFGVPMPETGEQDFALPEELVTEDTLRSNARKRRKVRREQSQTQLEIQAGMVQLQQAGQGKKRKEGS
jgi:hypothetical protein